MVVCRKNKKKQQSTPTTHPPPLTSTPPTMPRDLHALGRIRIPKLDPTVVFRHDHPYVLHVQ